MCLDLTCDGRISFLELLESITEFVAIRLDVVTGVASRAWACSQA